MSTPRWEVYDEADAGPIPPMDSAPVGGIDFATRSEAIVWLAERIEDGELDIGYGVRQKIEE